MQVAGVGMLIRKCEVYEYHYNRFGMVSDSKAFSCSMVNRVIVKERIF